MAAYNKFNDFIEQVFEKQHDCTADAFHWYLSNATPDAAADLVKTDLAEISAGNGYTAGGPDSQNTGAESTGTYTLTATAATISASGGTIGAFQYVVGYNNTHASDALVSWWNYGSALTLQDGETFTIKPNNSASTGTWFTAA